MLDPQAECPDCGSRLGSHIDCPKCGWRPAPVPVARPVTPEFVPPWKRPGFKDSKPEDPCDEPGCTLTIRDHIEEFKRAGERIIQRAVKL
jgi:hypothetical protein